MSSIQENLKYLRETFPEMVDRVLLQAQQNEINSVSGSLDLANEMLNEIRKQIQWLTSNTSRELRRRLRKVERERGERGG